MSDPRVAKLGDLLVNYSLELGPGQTLRIDAGTVAVPLVTEAYRSAVRAGANPRTRIEVEGLDVIAVGESSDDQLVFVSEIDRFEVEQITAVMTIWADRNTRALTQADPDRVSRRIASRRELTKRFWERIDAGEARWVGTRFPTEAHAQDAEMSLPEYEDFVYAACHVRENEDPVGHWRQVSTELNARARELESFRELRIVGPDTDLRLNVDGRGWLAADGKLNMPDGEIFTSPVETETDGEIRFSFPAIFHGRAVEDVRLRFEGGRVIDAEAKTANDYLHSLLDMDGGARVLGELAFGLNYEIDRFTRDILFDEKIGGTLHLALGSSFKKLGGENESGLHWDMICDLREDGEVYADGELVWKAGRFLHEPGLVAAAS
ncbi:MAG: aminopeptidase [Actinobacteria bacterium]|nr:MAG: aminopeptidase [Actinomycetota bacterium]